MSEWEDIEETKKSALIPALKNVNLLTCFSDEQLMQIISEAQMRNFNPGEMILMKGEISEALYIVGSGNAVVCLKKGNVPLGGASYFGEISLFMKKPVTCTVKAGEQGVRILSLPGKPLKEMVESTPQAKKIIQDIIMKRTSVPEKKNHPL
ncbi:MAG: cyclic nucleotide-binding domain-containing protein [bacterium]